MADEIPAYKIILLGEVGVGKTSLFARIKTGEFCDTQSSNMIYDFYEFYTTIGNDRIKV